MSASAARKLWASLEALHDVAYFAPGIREAGVGIGLRGFWMTYFAFRAAPMGAVDAGTVVATFAGFRPDMVEKALPAAWALAPPEACIVARARAAADALRAVGVDPEACRAAADRLATVATDADATGRPLYAANAALPQPADPIAALWQEATTLREHRGDGHIAALVVAGVSGLQAHLLQVAVGRYAAPDIRAIRGWDEDDWAEAAAQLRYGGLLTDDAIPDLTDAGRELLGQVEKQTDELAWTGALAPLGDAGVDEIVAILEPSVRAVWRSGILPDANPTGLPRPSAP